MALLSNTRPSRIHAITQLGNVADIRLPTL